MEGLAIQRGEVLPESWIGLGDAGRVADAHVRAAEADQREGHGHAVVVVGVEGKVSRCRGVEVLRIRGGGG